MTLITRITRLFKADLHGILDGLEEPEEVLKQAIRDMEEDIATQEHRLEELRAVLQRLEREAQETTATMQEIEPQIDLCFAAENAAAVDAFHAAALRSGGQDNGAPGLRPIYGPDYYAAFIIDPDGYRIEAYYGPGET